MAPTFEYENKLIGSNFSRICGIDEVGRGPLAGPVVAAAVLIDIELMKTPGKFKGINDSKKMTEKSREKWYEILTKCGKVKWGIGIVSEKIIDEINILEATKVAMMRALKNLIWRSDDLPDFLYFFENGKGVGEMGVSPLQKTGSEAIARNRGVSGKCNISLDEICILLDGNFTLDIPGLNQKAIIQGDAKVISISAASVIAKVTRDRMMQRFHEEYPEYGFDSHKGYGTALHCEMIKKFGPCAIHRKSFEPIKGMTRS